MLNFIASITIKRKQIERKFTKRKIFPLCFSILLDQSVILKYLMSLTL